MADFPSQTGFRETYTTLSPECDLHALLSTNASSTWYQANTAQFIPFTFQRPFIARSLFVINGATAAGNLKLAYYTYDLAKLVETASTAQSGTNAPQIIDITDTVIPAGRGYLACVMDGTTGTYRRTGGGHIQMARAMGAFQEASAFTLPATATPVAMTTANMAMVGIVVGRML